MKALDSTLLLVRVVNDAALQRSSVMPRIQQRLQGTWTATSAQRDGKQAPAIAGHQLVLVEDQFVLKSRDGDVLYRGNYQVNEQMTPAQIDFIHHDDWMEGTTWRGIFELLGDQLKICDNGLYPTSERPADFTTWPDSNRVSIVFEREA